MPISILDLNYKLKESDLIINEICVSDQFYYNIICKKEQY